ncbi:MAG TPA: AraC family transcriptional regulator, partial [Dongiaceae bacterium]|nr:AraC family transcriptional regulator [Dongiaceae bacterium]
NDTLEPLDLQLTQSASSISAAYLQSLLPPLAQHYGLDQDALLQRAGLSTQDWQNPEALLPLFQAGALFLEILRQSGDHGLGLVMGSLVQPRSYQVLGYAMMSSANLGEAIDRLIRYEKLVGKLGSTELLREDGECRLRWHCPFSGDWTRYLKEAAIAGWVTFARSLLAGEGTQVIAPARVCFDHAALIPPERYEAVFHCPVTMNAGWCGVEFSAQLLALPLHSADPGLRKLMDAQASQLLQDFEQTANLVNEVRACIAQALPNGEPSLDTVAARLQLTARALQHRLKQNGVAFKELVDSVRRALVLHYLRDPATSLQDITFLLGFSEQSAFSRAFRRWQGCSPQQYRKRATT